MRLGQLVHRDAPIVVFLEAFEADRAEDFLGRAELGQQPLEIVRALDAAAQLVGQHRFRGAGRPDHQHMVGGQQRSQRAIDQIGAFEEAAIQFVADARDFREMFSHRMCTCKLSNRGRELNRIA